MKPRLVLLTASFLLNAALAGAFFLRPALAPPAWRDILRSGAELAAEEARERQADRARAAARARERVDRAGAARARLWSRLASDDLATLVGRLRAAGFPATVVRGIVSARLQERYEAVLGPIIQEVAATPFWKTDSADHTGLYRVMEANTQLRRENSQLEHAVFADAFFAGTGGDEELTRRNLFGELSERKADLVKRINDDYAEMAAQIRAATKGVVLPEDREKLALLERERRADLAAILSPAELEDQLMRSSPVTQGLKIALSLIDATETEFRTIYRTYLPHADLLYPGQTAGLLMSTYGAYMQRRESLAEIDRQLRESLGEARATEFFRARHPDYQLLNRLAEQSNLPAEAAIKAFDLRNDAGRESTRIMDEPALSNDQKRAALRALARNTSDQLIATLGPTAGPAYVSSAAWLPVIANGGSVIFPPDSRGFGYRRVPPGNTPTPRGGP